MVLVPDIYRLDRDKVEFYHVLRGLAKDKPVTGDMLRYIVGVFSDNCYIPILLVMADDLDQGESLSGAMSEFPDYFSGYEILIASEIDHEDKEINVLEALYQNSDMAQLSLRQTKRIFVYLSLVLLFHIVIFCLFNWLNVLGHLWQVSHLWVRHGHGVVRKFYLTVAESFASDGFGLAVLGGICLLVAILCAIPARKHPLLHWIVRLSKGFRERRKHIEHFRIYTMAAVLVKRNMSVVDTLVILSNLEIQPSLQDRFGELARKASFCDGRREFLRFIKRVPKELSLGLASVLVGEDYVRCWRLGMSSVHQARNEIRNYVIPFAIACSVLLAIYILVGVVAFLSFERVIVFFFGS